MTDPRESSDPLATLIADIDQHMANASHLARMLYGEWKALVDDGMPALAAAVLIGTLEVRMMATVYGYEYCGPWVLPMDQKRFEEIFGADVDPRSVFWDDPRRTTLYETSDQCDYSDMVKCPANEADSTHEPTLGTGELPTEMMEVFVKMWQDGQRYAAKAELDRVVERIEGIPAGELWSPSSIVLLITGDS